MLTKELDTKSAGFYAYAAAINAAALNSRICSTYTQKERNAAQTAFDIIDSYYSHKKMYINYRKTFIAIKIDAAEAYSKRDVAKLDAVFATKGYTKVITPQGIVYRIPRK